MDKTKRIRNLVEQCNKYREEYYNQNNPSISDKEYDLLFDELKSLENKTGFVLSNSPTQSVGYEVVSKLNKVQHTIPLLSLDKTKSVEDIARFSKGKDLIAMHKLDGLTVELEYNNGKFLRGSTRGDGTIGEDITHNIPSFNNIPLSIDYNGYIKISGEAIIHKDDFDFLNSKLPEADRYKTPRNLVAGSVRQLDSKICADRNVYFYAYNILECVQERNYKSEDLEYLDDLGFETVDWTCTRSSIKYTINILKEAAKSQNIPIDGLVFTFDDLKYGESLGKTSHHPLHSIAFKFKDESEDTTLREIEWSMGRTGQLTPVAVFDTVELDGTEVSRASLHNISIIEKLQLGIGDTVSIAKMNMIIPQIIENKTKSNNLKIPDVCPICNGNTEVVKDNDSKVLVCKNPNCKGKLLGRLIHFTSKPAMNIEGLSESTLEKFIERGWLQSFSDIYRLDKYKDEIISLEGFGQKSYTKLWTAIQNSKNSKLNNFLVALGIPLIGRTASKVLSEQFEYDWYNIEYALNHGYDFTTLKDFGQTMAYSLMNWYKSDEYFELDNLMPYINFVKPQKVEQSNSPLSGKKLYCTGTFANYKKNELKELVASLGAEFASGYAKSLDYLVVGSVKGSSKEDKAQKDGVKILTEDEFIEMVGGK